MTDEIIKNLGPLAPLAGIWEGGKGNDTAPLPGPQFADYSLS